MVFGAAHGNPPPAAVLVGFGTRGSLAPVSGGQGNCWQAGDVIVKPCGLPDEVVWIAETLVSLPDSPYFRVAQPVRAIDGGWVVAGFEAWRVTSGAPDRRRWTDVLAVGEAFHSVVAGLDRPDFLDRRDNPWTYGERVAWDELPVDPDGHMGDLLRVLGNARRPVQALAQPVHGDLLGNVMFDDALPPVVIDWPLYFRPALWAAAIVVVDALVWQGAPQSLLVRPSEPEWRQMLLRALMFRVATNEGFRRAGLPVRESTKDYRRVVDLVLFKRAMQG